MLINNIKENVSELVIITEVKFIKKFLHAVCENCQWNEMAKVKCLYQSKGECTWQAVSQVFHPAIRCVRGTVSGFVQVQRGCRDNTILHRQKQLLSFQNEHFLYFLIIKAYWFEE